MGGYLRQSTAAVIPFGPFVDKTNGVDLEVGAGIITSIDHATTGIFLSKNGGAGAIRHQAVTASTLDAYGMFLVTLDTTDTNTIGRLRVMMAEAATFLPVYDDFVVLDEAVYDVLFGTTAPSTLAAGALMGLADDAITAAKIDTGAIVAATFAAGAIDAAAIAAGAIDNATFAADVGSTAYATNIIALAADKAVQNAALATAANLATVAGYLDTEIAAILEDTGTTIPAAIAALPTDADVNAQCDTAISDAALATATNLAAISTTIGVAGAGLTAVPIPSVAKKNTALAKFAFIMTDSTAHETATGKTVTCTRSVDGGAFGAGTLANVAELSDGIYNVDFGAGDLNGNVVVLKATATGCDDTFITIVTAK
jgi:hypothetical protein